MNNLIFYVVALSIMASVVLPFAGLDVVARLIGGVGGLLWLVAEPHRPTRRGVRSAPDADKGGVVEGEGEAFGADEASAADLQLCGGWSSALGARDEVEVRELAAECVSLPWRGHETERLERSAPSV